MNILVQINNFFRKFSIDIYATLSYYCRLILWVSILFGVVTGLSLVPDRTLSSLKSVICYSLLLFLLLFCKCNFPKLYDGIRWFCAPGNVFLKSWISLFFYVFLVRVPVDLLPVFFPQIISWIFQCILGNIFALGITAGIISISFYVIRKLTNSSLDKVDFDPNLEFYNTYNGESKIEYVSNLIDSHINSQVELSDSLEKQNEKFNEKSAEEVVVNPMVTNLNGNSDNANNRKVHFDDNSVNKSNDITGSEIANSLRELGVSFSIPINRESSMNSFSIRASNILSITQASKITKEVSRIKSIQRQQVEQTENSDIQINRISEIRLSYMKAVHPYNTNKNLPELYGLGECDRDSSISRHTLAEIKNKDNDFVISDRFTQTIRESFNKINGNSTIVDQQPYIPTMFHLLYFWIFMSILALLMEYSSSNIKKSNVLYFQISSTISVFIGSILFRLYLLSLHVHWLIMSTLQSVAIFLPTVIFIVIFTSNESYLNWENSLTQYKTSLSIIYFNYWGAGDIIAMLLPAAISSLAFSTVDAICQYYKLLPLIIPAVWISIIIIIIQGGILAYLLQSPTVTALTLLTRTITTPVAVEISELTGASSSITAASTIISAMISYLYAPYFLNKMNITNPIARGVGAAVSGTLLGVLSMDENGEDIAAGVGMAGYGIATILYASMMAIEGFRNFVVGIATS